MELDGGGGEEEGMRRHRLFVYEDDGFHTSQGTI
jgi:hypothetical protein